MSLRKNSHLICHNMCIKLLSEAFQRFRLVLSVCPPISSAPREVEEVLKSVPGLHDGMDMWKDPQLNPYEMEELLVRGVC